MFSLDWGYWITFALLLQDPHGKIPKGFVIRRFFLLFTLGSIYSTYASGADRTTETSNPNQT